MAIINNNNVQNVKFLRNASIYNSHDEAYAALTGFTLTNEQDGTAILARYTSGETVKTLVGFVYATSDKKTITIIDVEGASDDVQELREEIEAKLGNGIGSGESETVTAQLTALSGTNADTSATTSVAGAKAYADDLIGTLDGSVTAGEGYYVKSVTEVDGKISGTTEALPSVGAISVAGKAITAVSESNGAISATAGTINAEYVNVTGNVFTATTVQGALEEIDSEYKAAIEGLDYTDTATSKNFVIKVDEADGVISTTKGSITSSAKTIVLTDNEDGGVNFEVNYDNDTIVQDETTKKLKVASTALVQYVGDGKTIEISAVDGNNNKTVSTLLTLSSVTPSSEIIKEEYALKNASGETIGNTIKIYKDSHIVSINYITTGEHAQNLEYVYIDDSGNTQTTYVDMSELVLETEFGSGVTVTDHVAHGVVDSTSESFLTVGAGGFKLSGVQDAIDSAVSGAVETLDADKSGSTEHITVNVVEEDGIITAVTVEEDNIANANDLAGLSGKTFTVATSSNDSITTATAATSDGTVSVDLITDASKIKMSGFTADESGFTTITNATSVKDAFKAVETFVLNNELVVSSALNDLKATKLENIVVNGETGTVTSGIATVTIDGADIKLDGYSSGNSSAAVAATDTVNQAIGKLENKIAEVSSGSSDALVAEIAARKAVDGISAQTYQANAGTRYISGASSLNNADVLLNNALDAVETRMVSGATMNGSAITKSNETLVFSAQASNSAATSENSIVITTANDGGLTFQLGTIDCGTY